MNLSAYELKRNLRVHFGSVIFFIKLVSIIFFSKKFSFYLLEIKREKISLKQFFFQFSISFDFTTAYRIKICSFEIIKLLSHLSSLTASFSFFFLSFFPRNEIFFIHLKQICFFLLHTNIKL